MKFFIAAFFCCTILQNFAQDTTVSFEKKWIVMPAAILRNNLNPQKLIKYVMHDTSFYKAFKNLKILNFSAYNDVKMQKKDGTIKASLNSKTQQSIQNKCRKTTVIEEITTGDFYTTKHQYNYYTAEMYASIMFAIPEICNEDNIVGTGKVDTKGVKGLEKQKQRLKMLFFNPGKGIKGIPLMGDKTALFEDDMAKYYNYTIETVDFMQTSCYQFTTKAKDSLTKSERGNLVIDEMTTWFRSDNWQIMGRNYKLSYNAGVYDFDVEMQVEIGAYKNYVVPTLIRYKGNWDIAFKKRERGIFTATLFDFNN
jgi:hypothetical protein